MTLKQCLQQFGKEELIGQITELHKKYNDVKEYYAFHINPDEKKTLEKYKAIIRDAFYPKRGFDLKLAQARKAVNDYKKLSPSAEHLADAMLYYVECGVEFTNDYGDINEPFYNSIESMFVSASEYITEYGLANTFRARAKKIKDDTENIGWGFHDALADTFYQNFEASQ